MKCLPRRFGKELLVFFVFTCALLFPKISFGQITIDSIHTTISNCPNDGSLTVYAKSPAPALFYSIIAGPVTQPTQTSNVFSSLPPGTYTVRVEDGSLPVTQNVTITGNYVQLDFTPLTTNPYCIGSSNGQIIGNIMPGTGNGPFTWQLVSPSPVTTGPQSSDTFNNLPAGNYSVRLSDACGGFRTIVASLNGPQNTINLTTPPRVEIIGCDSGMLTLFLHEALPRFPLTYTITTNSGSFTTNKENYIDTTSYGYGDAVVELLVPNFTYGDQITITITNSCGDKVTSPFYSARPLSLCPVATGIFKNCTYLSQISFDIFNPGCIGLTDIITGITPPVNYQFVDAATNAIMDSATITGDSLHRWFNAFTGVTLKLVPANKTYNFILKDGCGHVFTYPYFVAQPVTPSPNIYKQITQDACIDSVALASISAYNFKTAPTLIFLSGPSVLQNTKPGYEYSGTYHYPDSIFWGGSSSGAFYPFYIKNLTTGKYQFKIIDSCGSEIFDSLEIKPADVANLGHTITYKKGCLGKNELHYSFNTGNGYMIVNGINGTNFSGLKYYQTPNLSAVIKDSLMNLPSGTFVINFNYQGYITSSFGTYAADYTNLPCTQILDTIVIQGYQTPTIKTYNYIKCKSSIQVELIPDSSTGVPPYQYEIISGPKSFPIQNSNVFSITQAGTYNARIFDICGNASTAQITVAPIDFPPINSITNCNIASLFYGSSAYYTYDWTKPNGTIYTGDTLTINPITSADTGTYTIKKTVNISGCIDSFFTTYHLSLPHLSKRDTTICNGDSVSFGSHNYKTTGIYTDTLVGSSGCDSLVQLNLTVNDYKRNIIFQTICAGKSFTVNGHAYTQTGAYLDTLSTATCDSIVILILTVDNNCPATALCSGATHTVWKDDFRSGSPANGGPSPYVNPTYINQNNGVGSGNYSLVNYFNAHPGVWHLVPEDHTPNDVGGYFLVVDGGNPDFYSARIDNLCPNTDYTFSAWTMNMDLPAYPSLPTFIFNVTDTLGNAIGQLATPSIPVQTAPTWVNNGFTFNSGNNTSVKLSIVLTSNGFNDFAFDDLALSVCGPTLNLTPAVAGCSNKVTITANLGSGYTNPVYQWYKQNNGIWESIINATSTTYLDNNPAQNNQYKLTVKDGVSSCSYIEDSLQVTLNNSILAAINIDTTICSGQSAYGHATTGSYIVDTLKSSNGCDSLQRTVSITIAAYKRDSINQSICQGQSFIFNTHTYTQPGTYRDTMATSTCDSIAVLNLTVNPYKRNTIARSVCTGQAVTIGNHTYNKTGIYNDTLTTTGCDSIVTLNLTVTNYKQGLLNQTICVGQSFVFGNHTYTQAGTYRDTSTTSTCDSITILTLTVVPVPLIDITASSYNVNKGDVIQLTVAPSLSYLWSSPTALLSNTIIRNPSATINTSSWIYVTTTSNIGSCISIDSVFILVTAPPDPCTGSYIYLPSAFTPNGDGLNDLFKIYYKNITLKDFQVFNRWGERVFETTDKNKGWDGTYKGEMTAGNYVYWVSYYLGCETNAKLLKGNVVLVR